MFAMLHFQQQSRLLILIPAHTDDVADVAEDDTHLSCVPWTLSVYVCVSLRSTDRSLEELRVSLRTTPKRSTLATCAVVSPPRSRVKNQRTSYARLSAEQREGEKKLFNTFVQMNRDGSVSFFKFLLNLLFPSLFHL